MPGCSSIDTVHDADRPTEEATRYVLLVVDDSGSHIVPLPTAGVLVVGRGDSVDVQLADARISRHHLRIHVGARFQVEDLCSANGTVISGQRLFPGVHCTVAPGVAICAGSSTLFIRDQMTGVTVSTETEPGRTVIGDRMAGILALADRAAGSLIPVLLLGETGVGKDVLAERIHHASPRASGPFLRLNCAAFSSALLASELFGHEKGAFTGATSTQPGLLQTACGGTVLLDEVGDLPPDLQATLLLVLERREVLPVGAVRSRPLDVRFVSATNRDLREDVDAGRFRSDLYFRLAGIVIEVPPLRARVSEIEPLARLFAQCCARSIGRPVPELSDEVLDALRDYSWPGNIRELRNVIERVVLLGSGDSIDVSDIFPSPQEAPAEAPAVAAGHDGSHDERQQILDALARCGGNQTRAAKQLGVSRNTLIARIQKHGIARPLSPRAPR